MAIYPRGNWLWTNFYFEKKHIQENTQVRVGKRPKAKQQNYKRAVAYEERRKNELRDPSLVKVKRERPPTLQSFKERFIKSVETRLADKPLTIEFYKSKLQNLLRFTPLAETRLDQIDEGMIESYVQHRQKVVRVASVNRELATLRKALRLAQDWKLIDRVPRIRLLRGERVREFVLSDAQEQLYLDAAPQPLHDVALLGLDTGMRPGEELALKWGEVHFEPARGARLGYIHVKDGKTRNAKRNLSLTPRVRSMLESAEVRKTSVWVFTNETGAGPLSRFRLRDQHDAVRQALNLPQEFVVYCLRHTFGTRLGESGADAFTIMKIMGHSSVTVSQRYVHPTPETLERAFERLEERNQRAAAKLLEEQKRLLPATVSTTVEDVEVDTELEVA
ncbi:MAG: tyrosine-type recombinase/integrase [Acidobacteriia bacterium]|nr:tyrosine-type recombinase/integrase [Terriglobia bacterium]